MCPYSWSPPQRLAGLCHSLAIVSLAHFSAASVHLGGVVWSQSGEEGQKAGRSSDLVFPFHLTWKFLGLSPVLLSAFPGTPKYYLSSPIHLCLSIHPGPEEQAAVGCRGTDPRSGSPQVLQGAALFRAKGSRPRSSEVGKTSSRRRPGRAWQGGAGAEGMRAQPQ